MVRLVVPLLLLVAAGCREHSSPADVLGPGDLPAKVRSAALENGVHGATALAGARLYATSGCAQCHTYAGVGNRNLGAPDLTAEGARGKGVGALVEFLRCPGCSDSNSAMPPFKALGPENLRKIAVFLEASKGKQ
jgi:mono/diheme cytochrome c family protein